ncbi:MAG: hypothetical protein AAGG99_03710 [Pseudomonadota bacterium]
MMDEWRNARVDEMLDYIHPDAEHIVHVDGDVVPQLASVSGRENMRQRFEFLSGHFHIEAFDIDTLIETDNHLRSIISYRYSHKQTSERIESTIRLELVWDKDAFVRVEEFVDAPIVEAFLRITGEIS